MKIENKIAVVTGAASGIGLEIAKTFVREGAKVAIADLNLDAANKTAADLGGDAVAIGVAMDVSNEAQVDAGMDAVAQKFGGIDILVSNAGIQIVAPIIDFKFDDWKKLLAIHLDGAFLTTRAAMRYMVKQEWRK